jgi:hypothetical protein
MREAFDNDVIRLSPCGDPYNYLRWQGMAAMIAIAAETNATDEYNGAMQRYRNFREAYGGDDDEECRDAVANRELFDEDEEDQT